MHIANRPFPFRLPFSSIAAALLLLSATGGPAAAQTTSEALGDALRNLSDSESQLQDFYRQRAYRPLWIEERRLSPAVGAVLDVLGSADADGLDPAAYLRPALLDAVRLAAAGSPSDLARAELELSRSFAAYVRDSRTVREIGIVYAESALRPAPPSTSDTLAAVADAPARRDYITSVRWLHPIYAALRRAIQEAPQGTSPEQVRILKLNLERARALPAGPATYILVDAAAAQLTYFEKGHPKKSMRVVVGTAHDATPMMVGMLRKATLNPYWHVPADLTRERIAPRVLSEGIGYFEKRGYEVVTEWWPSVKVADPRSIDWNAVAQGHIEIFVRQKPGPQNGMGKVKFQFQNELGIYLHDTPAKHLFELDDRSASAGCVRLEDPDGLARILFGRDAETSSTEPEQTLELPEPVPIYITYLTAAPVNGRIVRRKDIYGRDKAQLAADEARPGPVARLE